MSQQGRVVSELLGADHEETRHPVYVLVESFSSERDLLGRWRAFLHEFGDYVPRAPAEAVRAAFEQLRRPMRVQPSEVRARYLYSKRFRVWNQSELAYEWDELLWPHTQEEGRAAAAADYGGVTRLNRFLSAERQSFHRNSLHAAIADGAETSGQSHTSVMSQAIARAARIAALEVHEPQERVLVTVDGSRRIYTRNCDGGRIVPARDLPPSALESWLRGRVRRHVLDEFVPDWRARESEDRHDLAVLSLDEPLPDANGATLSDMLEAPPREDAGRAGNFDLKHLSPSVREYALMRVLGLTHKQIAAHLGIGEAAARQRWARRLKPASRAGRPAQSKSRAAGRG